MTYFFSYGTIQERKVQLQLYGRILTGEKDSLPGFKTTLVENKDPASLARGEEKFQRLAIPSANFNDRIEGTVYELMDDELELTDKYEPAGYSRVKLQLQSGKEAWIYVGA